MTFEDFVRGIRFRKLDPQSESVQVNLELRSWPEILKAQRGIAALDAGITLLPDDHDDTLKRLRPIIDMPRLSTFATAAIIQRAVREMAAECCYLNVGVWYGYSLLAGMLGNPERRIIGIDDFSEFGGPREEATSRFEAHRSECHELLDLDYRVYLRERHQGEIGLYFYDGPHEYADQLDALRLAESFFAPGCIILVDDTNWDAPRQATLDFMAKSQLRYETLLDQRTAWEGHPTFWNGLMVIRRES